MLERLLVERIEHRVIVGTVAFLGIMVLVGWLAINEGGRMQAFEQQFLARSTERGAALFTNNCTSCHGADGRGLTGIAPALNNPQLFGHNFLAEIDAQIEPLQAELDTDLTPERIAEIDATRSQLETELALPVTSEERKAEIEVEMAELDAQLANDLPDERAAELRAQLDPLNTQRLAILQQMQGAIARGYDPETPSRLTALGWGGTLDAFVHTTLISGRPVSSAYWPQPMAAWSQTAGGPLRDDQITDLTNYILNWDKGDNWTVEDLLAVQQFAIEPVQPGAGAAAEFEPVGTDVAAILTRVSELSGDPVRGEALYNGSQPGPDGLPLACSGCHLGGAAAPNTEGTWTRASGERLQEPALAGYTPEQYLIESIVLPNNYIAPGYAAGVMPQNFGERLTDQDMADMLAYLRSQDQ
jgi:mono/diheme cytochrome c family protein